jgi:hypothetical protein
MFIRTLFASLAFGSGRFENWATGSVRHNHEWNEERDEVVERLCDFLNLDYVPATEVARSLKVRRLAPTGQLQN